jgi:hypothetical protein
MAIIMGACMAWKFGIQGFTRPCFTIASNIPNGGGGQGMDGMNEGWYPGGKPNIIAGIIGNCIGRPGVMLGMGGTWGVGIGIAEAVVVVVVVLVESDLRGEEAALLFSMSERQNLDLRFVTPSILMKCF